MTEIAEISDIGFYVGIYVLLAALITAICIFLFPESEYIKTAPVRMSYTQYVVHRITEKLSEIWGNVQQVTSNMHRQIVEMVYPDIAKNMIYR